MYDLRIGLLLLRNRLEPQSRPDLLKKVVFDSTATLITVHMLRNNGPYVT